MSRKSAGNQHLTNEEMERLLAGNHGGDSVLGRYLARLQEISAAKPGAEVADRDRDAIARELENARDRRSGRMRRPLSTTIRRGAGRIHIPIRRLAPRTVLVSFGAVVMTAGIAAGATGNLPAPAQNLISKTMAGIGIDIPPADTVSPQPANVGSTVPVAGDPGRQQDSAVRPTVGWGEIPEPSVDTRPVPPEAPDPTLEVPRDRDLPVDPPDGRAAVAPPAKPGPSDDPGPSDHAPPDNPGPSDQVGPPPGLDNPGSSDQAGPPTNLGPADNPGPPDQAGPPTNLGPQDNPGPPDHAGPPTNPGLPDNPGAPGHAGAGALGQPQSGFRTGEDSG